MSKNSINPTDPLDIVTSRFQPKEILYNHNGFVVAKGLWCEPGDSESSTAIAARWHTGGYPTTDTVVSTFHGLPPAELSKEGRVIKQIDEDTQEESWWVMNGGAWTRIEVDPKAPLGYPNGFGRPQWMLLPVDPADARIGVNAIREKDLELVLRGPCKEVITGKWALVESGRFQTWHLITYVYGRGDEMFSGIGQGKGDSYPVRVDRITDIAEGKSALAQWHGGRVLLWMNPYNGLFCITGSRMPLNEGHTDEQLIAAENVYAKRPLLMSLKDGQLQAVELGGALALGHLYQLNKLMLVGTIADHVVHPLTDDTLLEKANQLIAQHPQKLVDGTLSTDKTTEQCFSEELQDFMVPKMDTFFGHEKYWVCPQ